ncbi:hypothetical protein [Streptomyces sp. SID13031]|uniref:hypothetical protein n=1 Tax=Streptomyces sp. SID13031 TaxID=2706046 RepID=UPI0013C8FD85|nr:hypothetical protein [Streptomyces sp. SID13031]NEA34322.1 hypothetical protein [Streptomyces sp. SID13031]
MGFTIGLVAALVGGLAFIASPASAADKTEQWAQIDSLVAKQLSNMPGGHKVARNKIEWPKLGAVMEYPSPDQTIQLSGTVHNCAPGYTCLYGDGWFNSPNVPARQRWQLSFYYCNLVDLGAWGVRNQASSWVNNQPNLRAALHQYRYDSTPANGYVQLWAAYGYAENGDTGPSNDKVDLVDPC